MLLINTVIPVDQEKVEKWMRQISQAVMLVKLMAGIAFSCGVLMVGTVMWFSNTTSAIASTEQKMEVFQKDYQERLKEWTTWRVEMERTTVRLVAVQEAQQKLMERLTDRMDRVGPR